MNFIVTSSPAPVRPSTAHEGRRAFREWMQSQLKSGVVKHAYARIGRGAIVVFDVESHEALHALLNQWTECVPATFEVAAIMPWTYEGRGLPPAAPATAP